MIFLILTTVLIIAMFIYTFARMIKNNSLDNIYVLIAEFIGIVIDFICIVVSKKPSIYMYMLIYFISIVLPLIVFGLEMKDIYIGELILLFPHKNISKESLLQIIEKKSSSYIAHKKLAEYYRENQEKEKAEDEYIKLIQLRPKEYSNYCTLARIFEENNKSDEAIDVLQELLQVKPDSSEASLLLGNILYNNAKFKEAILVYNQALKYNPKEYYLYYQLGMTYTRINDFNNAKDCYQKAATINSIQDISNLSIGQIYMIFEEYENAEQFFYKTLDSEDDKILANSYYYLAKIKLIQKNMNQAIQYANMAIECDPEIIRRMEQDNLFIPVLGNIKIKPKEKINTKLGKKDLNTIEHLGKTYNVVETLTNNFPRNLDNKEKELE